MKYHNRRRYSGYRRDKFRLKIVYQGGYQHSWSKYSDTLDRYKA